MNELVENTVAVLLASGLSRRFKRRDKLLQDIGGKPLFEHMAARLTDIDFAARVAVCAPRSDEMREQLAGRFVIAPNASPEAGLGVSISVGVRVAMQFRPQAVLLVLADMPFVEPSSLSALLTIASRNSDVEIVHAGKGQGARPPAVFRQRCFEALQVLKGDHGASSLLKRPNFQSVGLGLAEPELFDVDTVFDLETARRQWKIRQRYEEALDGAARQQQAGGAAGEN